ncbi:MAG: Gfo/Idh/MocA family oxidoreductase [Kiritimatiellae bacterium]|nr:Gfo/Idh/MocA family oxidoreductase [Kiritimatiellia bacterium]
MKKVRIALIGCGAAGMSHLKAMLSVRGLQLKAVCDLNRKYAKRAAEFAGVPFYLDAETLMKREELDGVAIIATAHAHYPLLMLAARHKLHAICEKPLTLKPAEGKRVVAAFKRARRLLAVTFTFRYVPSTRRLKQFIDKGTIGKVLEVRHVGWGGLAEKYRAGTENRVKYDRMYEGDIRGILFDCGVHTFDLFRWLSGGEYVKFLGMGVCHKGYDYPDSGSVLCEMDNGVRCLYEHGPLPHYMNGADGIPLGTMCVAGTKGSLVFKIAVVRRNGHYLSEFQVHTKRGSRSEMVPLYGKLRDKQYADFVRSVRAGKLRGSFPSPEEANKATDAACRAVDAVLRNVVGTRRAARAAARRY